MNIKNKYNTNKYINIQDIVNSYDDKKKSLFINIVSLKIKLYSSVNRKSTF